MGLLNWIGKITKPRKMSVAPPRSLDVNQKPMKSGSTVDSADALLATIPDDVKALLWVTRFENHQQDGTDEPSLIDLSLPVASGEADPLNYYPEYRALSPQQRFVYLRWLTDIDQIIDPGYVFLFYYGLERQLETKNAEPAAAMISRLKAHCMNRSFQYYSDVALAYASLRWHNPEFLTLLRAPHEAPAVFVFAAAFFDHSLTPENMMAMATNLGSPVYNSSATP